MPEPVTTYECRATTGVQHGIPGPDVRVMRIGDGGFVVACDCADEELDETDSEPHPTTDHLVNIFADDPTPEDWLRLEDDAEGWYGTTRWHSPAEGDLDGTHGQRRSRFRDEMEAIADRDDGRDLEPSQRERRARDVECPNCGANAGRKCQRPNGHRVRTPHADRVDAAVGAGVISPEGGADARDESEQVQITEWSA